VEEKRIFREVRAHLLSEGYVPSRCFSRTLRAPDGSSATIRGRDVCFPSNRGFVLARGVVVSLYGSRREDSSRKLLSYLEGMGIPRQEAPRGGT
jgi:hypothetical protein